MDRRLNPRTASHARVKLYLNGNTCIHAQLNDFSQGGVSLALEHRYPLPAMDEVIFMLAENTDETYSMQMVRTNYQGWVLKFMD